MFAVTGLYNVSTQKAEFFEWFIDHNFIFIAAAGIEPGILGTLIMHGNSRQI
jgi:hypothetical protein